MLVDMPCCPRDAYAFWVFPHVDQLIFKPVRIGDIVCIVACDKLRATVHQPCIECRDDPSLGLVDDLKASVASRHFCEQMPGIVGRAIIHNKDPDAIEGLRLNALNRCADRFRAVKNRDNDID